MREDRGILTPQTLAETLLKDLTFLADYWMEREGLEQVLVGRYGNQWRDRLNEFVEEIIDKELLNGGYKKEDVGEWLHEYEEVVEYALGTIVESQPFRRLADYVRERLMEEVMQNRLDMEM